MWKKGCCVLCVMCHIRRAATSSLESQVIDDSGMHFSGHIMMHRVRQAGLDATQGERAILMTDCDPDNTTMTMVSKLCLSKTVMSRFRDS